MTVSSSTNRNDYAGNGSTTSFAVSFRFLENSHVKATLRDASGGETLQVETTNYTLTGAGDAGGGTLVMLVPPPSGETLTILRDVPATQETDYVENDEFPAESHEDALDKLTMLVQQQGEDSTRHLGFSDTVSDATGSAVELNQDATQRADTFLGFDTLGNIVTKTASVAGLVDQDQQDQRYGPIFATVAAMTAANPVSIDGVVVNIAAGMTVNTQEYFPDNGGRSEYLVKTASQSATDGDIIDELGNLTAANGLVLIIQAKSGIVSIRQFGAKLDTTILGTTGTDDAPSWKAIIEFANNDPAHPEIICDGFSLLAAASLQNGTGIWGTIGGINGLSDITISFVGGAWVLQPNEDYPQVFVPLSNANNITLNKPIVWGNNSFANGLVLSGIGGGVNDNIIYNDPIVLDIRSENTLAAGDITRREGGAAYIIEQPGTGGIYRGSAVRCSVARRFAPDPDVNVNFDCVGFYSEECETTLSTNPSGFDNRDFAQDTALDKFAKPNIKILGDTFRNCGKSSDALTQLSFIWRDTSADNGQASGNYYPWAGIKSGPSSGTYGSQNWEPATFSAGDTEWNPASTYVEGNRVKVTNNEELGSIYSFARSCSFLISGTRGWNDHFTSTYPEVGSIFAGIMRNVHIEDVQVDVKCKAIFHFGTVPSASFGLQPFMISKFVTADDVWNIGPVVAIAKSDMPWNGNWFTSFTTFKAVDFEKNVESVQLRKIYVRGVSQIVDASLKTDAPAEVTEFDDSTYLEYINIVTGTKRAGRFSDFAGVLSNSTTPGIISKEETRYTDIAGVPALKVFANTTTDMFHDALIDGGFFRWRGRKADATVRDLFWKPEDSAFFSGTDNVISLGKSGNRWTTVFATTGTIDTSDRRSKQDDRPLSEAEKLVAIALKGMVKTYRLKDSVIEKGDGARWHVGLIAQEVVDAFASEGLNAYEYGMLCFDEWEDEYDADGVLTSPGGERFGLRYAELMAFIIGAM